MVGLSPFAVRENLLVNPPSTEHTFPSPYDLSATSPSDAPGLYAQAPWFVPCALGNVALTGAYATRVFLPGGIPAEAGRSMEWRVFGAIPRFFV